MDDEVRIALPDEDLASLRDWLNDTPELRGHIELKRSAIPAGQMGSSLLLAIALASPAIINALSHALTSWLAQRRSETKLELTKRDGTRVTISNKGPSRPEELLRQISAVVDSPSDTSPSE
jgi:hypothetical protein